MSQKTHRQTSKILGYLGLVPFVFFLWAVEVTTHNIEHPLAIIEPQQGFLFYSAIILSFLAGTLWKKDASLDNSASQILSNIFCLIAFTCLFIPLIYALTLLSSAYLCLLWAEYLLCYKQQPSFTRSYFSMRLRLTIIVIALHGTALVAWF